MPLPIASSESLSIPEAEFNEHGLAVVFLSGGRYGGDWVIGACTEDSGGIGEFSTDGGPSKAELERDSRYPDLAAETAFTWLRGEAGRLGLRVVAFDCLNSRYGPAERPYFCLARAVVANASFEPKPGAVYADEMTLDAVMGYGQEAAR